MEEHPLRRILHPRSIVIAGASNNPLKMGTSQALSLLNQGFTGDVAFLHPTETQVLGHPTYASPRDLPGPVDLAILIVPTPVVPGLLHELGEVGVRRAIIVTGGFREMGEEGRALEEEVLRVARRHSIRFLGPNCIGAINMAVPFNCTYFPNPNPRPGAIGLISQSGTYVTQVQGWLATQHIGLAQAVSVGNQADLDVVDVLEYFAQQDDIRAIGLYLEGLPRGERFVEVARRTVAEAGKPLVALYVGGSEAGARAGASHTGALAAPDAVMEGVLQQSGVVRVTAVEDLFQQTWMLAHQPPMRGPRLGMVTHSGGPAATVADAAEAQGLVLPELSDRLQQSLREDLPPTGQSRNPVDMTYMLRLDLLSDVLPRRILESGEVDGLIIHGVAGAGMGQLMFDNVRRLLPEGATYEMFKGFIAAHDPIAPLCEMPGELGLPIVHSAFHDRHDENMIRLVEAGIPTLESPEQTVALLARSYRSHTLASRIRASRAEATPVPSPADAKVVTRALLKDAAAKGPVLAEHDAKAVLAAWGIPLVPEVVVDTAADAVSAAATLGLPVVLKLSAPGLAHKTEVGAVRLDLQDPEAVKRAANELLALAHHRDGARLLVAPRLTDPRELVAGLTRRPGLPTLVMFGWGGVFTEVLKDRAFRLAPFDLREAEALLADTRADRLLAGVRGLPPVDRPTLAALLCTLGALGRAHPEIASLDLNPILVDPAGHPVVVDALIEVTAASG